MKTIKLFLFLASICAPIYLFAEGPNELLTTKSNFTVDDTNYQSVIFMENGAKSEIKPGDLLKRVTTDNLVFENNNEPSLSLATLNDSKLSTLHSVVYIDPNLTASNLKLSSFNTNPKPSSAFELDELLIWGGRWGK